MAYSCPKGHQSTDSDYCSECGALIGKSKISNVSSEQSSSINMSVNTGTSSQDICPDCGTPRTLEARFCEVCRHDFQEKKTGVAEVIVASQKTVKEVQPVGQVVNLPQTSGNVADKASINSTTLLDSNISDKEDNLVFQKLNVIISVDKDKIATCEIQTAIKPDVIDRIFPLDLDENLVGRRSTNKGIYPEIEINDPGVSHRHLKFLKQKNGSFSVLDLGSANGTELNGIQLVSGVITAVKAGDELTIGIWTKLKLISR